MSALSKHLMGFCSQQYLSQEKTKVNRQVQNIEVKGACDYIIKNIDIKKGALFSSSYDYPGRYSQWDIGFIDPCLEIRAQGRNFTIKALKSNGLKLMRQLYKKLQTQDTISSMSFNNRIITGSIKLNEGFFPEEERSRQPTVFSLIRSIRELFFYPDEYFLGLYGAFGYDLVYQFEPLELKKVRAEGESDLVLYLPDDFIVVDHRMGRAYRLNYDFSVAGEIDYTDIMEENSAYEPEETAETHYSEMRPGAYAEIVVKAKESFQKGDLFEVVPSHCIYEECPFPPSQVFSRLKAINPSPYGFIINLGSEHLVGASPEMYVRVEGNRVETCPISGTIKRGRDAVEDAVQIQALLNSAKDEAELTMCTDVDRNDKSRICMPGSVKVIGRRQIEMYSHLIHTVDHVEGYLRPEFDSLDAFLTHMWAVTVTGAPKRAAIKWLEENEFSPRGWYGGAVGYLSFNGDMSTGLTLRTIKIKDEMAEIRVGATLLYDSIPEAEEEETLVKAAALVKAIRSCGEDKEYAQTTQDEPLLFERKKVLLVDHEDSFVHTLANYFKQAEAYVQVVRSPLARQLLGSQADYDLVVLSPGPGRPAEFNLNDTIQLCVERSIPVFGVCLGLQGIVEYFGGSLEQLGYPQHGKSSLLRVSHPAAIWEGLPEQFGVGRYHSLYAEVIPDCLRITAMSADGVVMAVEHKELPLSAVQFHPESILTSHNDTGLKLIKNVINQL